MIGALALAATIAAAPLAGARIPIEAVVLKVDHAHARATIKYAALETAPGGIRVVAINDPHAFKRLWVGESIRALADTSRTPWVVSHVVAVHDRADGAHPNQKPSRIG